MKIYEWGDNTGWISSVIYKDKKKLLEHIRSASDDGAKFRFLAYIYEIDTIKETRKKIETLYLR